MGILIINDEDRVSSIYPMTRETPKSTIVIEKTPIHHTLVATVSSQQNKNKIIPAHTAREQYYSRQSPWKKKKPEGKKKNHTVSKTTKIIGVGTHLETELSHEGGRRLVDGRREVCVVGGYGGGIYMVGGYI